MTKHNHTKTISATVICSDECHAQTPPGPTAVQVMSSVPPHDAQGVTFPQNPTLETVGANPTTPDERNDDRDAEPSCDQHDPAQCPFVYANGKRCEGWVTRIRAYGPWDRKTNDVKFVRKYRLWCSAKWDHAGSRASWTAKQRMEFYPDQVSDDLLEWAEREGIVEV